MHVWHGSIGGGDKTALKINDTGKAKNAYKITRHRAGHTGNVGISEHLFKEAVRISRDSFASVISEEEVTRLVLGKSLLLVAYDASNLKNVGFASSHYSNNICNFSSAAVVKSAQNNGIYFLFNRWRISEGLNNDLSTFTVTTQNPNVEKGISYALGTFIEEGRIKGYSVQRGYIRGYYGRMLTTEVPVSSDEGINREFSSLNYMRGDAFCITFAVKKRRGSF